MCYPGSALSGVFLIVSTRRSALKPFTLSDGTTLNVGDWACTPVKAIMQSPEHYPAPLQFNGFRFVDPERFGDGAVPAGPMQPRPSKLTDVNNAWHVWGTGRMAWYAMSTMFPSSNSKLPILQD